jgi:cell division transport system permease protein
MIAALRYFLTEALFSLWRGRRASLLSILTIAIGLFVLGVFLILTTNLGQLVDRWRGAAEFSIYLKDTVTDGERDAVVRAVRAHPAIAGVDFVSKPDALLRFTRDFPDLAAAARTSPSNPFPASLEVRLASATVDTNAIERLAQRVERMPGISDVRYDRRWLERLSSVAASVRWTGFALSAVLILAAAFTITNVVRLALFARRDEIEIMELVGAPMSFIRGPFICEGILQGAFGALFALVLLRVAFAFARASLDAVAQLAGSDGAVFLPLSAALLLLGGGALVGCVGSLFAVRRFQ